MQQFGCRRNLSLKASKCRRILRHCRWQHLDRHDAVHPAMLSPENLPHAPGTDFVENRVAARISDLVFPALTCWAWNLVSRFDLTSSCESSSASFGDAFGGMNSLSFPQRRCRCLQAA